MNVFWWFFWVLIVVLWIAIGWPRTRATSSDIAIETLRQRYASGEIDESEYRERLAVLRGATPSRRAPPRDTTIPPTSTPHAAV